MPFIAIFTFKHAVEQQLIVATSKAIKHLESMPVQQIKYLYVNPTLKNKYYVGNFYVQEVVALRTVRFSGAQQSHRIACSLLHSEMGDNQRCEVQKLMGLHKNSLIKKGKNSVNKEKQGIHSLCHMVLCYFLERRDSSDIRVTRQQKLHNFEHFLMRKYLVE